MSEEGTECVYFSHCKFVGDALGVNPPPVIPLMSHLYHMAQNILELFIVHILSLTGMGMNTVLFVLR